MTMTFALMLAWVAIHLVMALGAGYLATTRRGGREYGTYAMLCFSMAVYCTGSAWLSNVGSVRESGAAQALQLAGAWCAFGSIVPFACAVSGLPLPRLERASAIMTVLGVILVSAGVYFDPATPTHGEPLLPVEAPPFQAATVPWTMLDRIPIGIVLVLTARHTMLAARALGPAIAIGASCVVGVAWVIEATERVLARPTSFMTEHAAAVASVLIGFGLTRRFVDAERELDRRNRDLRRAYDELRQMQSELVRKEQLAAVGELSAVIAHEIRNPLAILKTAVAGLRKTELDDDNRGTLLGILDEETDRLNRLVRDLLAYARPVALQAEPIDVAELVRSTFAGAMRARKRPEPIELSIDLPQVLDSVPGDRALLERAFSNVLENAIEAMPFGGRLSVVGQSATRDGRSFLMLSFADTGEGMDTLVRSRAREPFFTTRPSGTGLGLAIVERVITAHDGFVELARNTDSGTVVTLALPMERASLLDLPAP